MQRNETYDLPPPALSGSGSKGTSQLFSAPGDETTKCFRLCRQMELAVAMRTEDIRFMSLKNRIVRRPTFQLT